MSSQGWTTHKWMTPFRRLNKPEREESTSESTPPKLLHSSCRLELSVDIVTLTINIGAHASTSGRMSDAARNTSMICPFTGLNSVQPGLPNWSSIPASSSSVAVIVIATTQQQITKSYVGNAPPYSDDWMLDALWSLAYQPNAPVSCAWHQLDGPAFCDHVLRLYLVSSSFFLLPVDALAQEVVRSPYYAGPHDHSRLPDVNPWESLSGSRLAPGRVVSASSSASV